MKGSTLLTGVELSSTEHVRFCPLCGSEHRIPWDRRPADITAVQCRACGLVYMDRRLTDSAAAGHYEGYNRSRDDQHPDLLDKRQRMYEWDRRFLRLFLTAGRLLDIGCGVGDFLGGFEGSFEATGYDVDSSALEDGRRRHSRVSFVGDRAGIMARAPYDGIVFRGSLQYMRNLADIAELVEGIIEPTGWLFVLATPNVESPVAVLQREHWALRRWDFLYSFSLKTLGELFRGFRIHHFDFPYIGTPYEHRSEDLERFRAVCRGETVLEGFPFWGSMMNVALQHGST